MRFNPLKILNILSPASNLFKGGKNPHEEALPYLNAIPQFGREAYNPFIQQGQYAQNQLTPHYEQFTHNPVDYLNQVLGQYEPSTGYQHRYQQAMKGANAAAASGGFAGNDQDQIARAKLVNSLMGEDQQQFLQNVLGIQGAGIQGLEGQVGRGFQAAGGLADYLGGSYGQLAGSASQGRAQKNASHQALMNALIQAGAGAAGAYAGGMGGGFGGFGPSGGYTSGMGQNSGFGQESLFGSYNPRFRNLNRMGGY